MRPFTTSRIVVIDRSMSGGSRGSLRGDGRLLCTIPMFCPAIFRPNPKMIRAGKRSGRYETSNKGGLH